MPLHVIDSSHPKTYLSDSGGNRVSTAPKIRVLLVEDHLLVRQGLRRMLESDPRIEVIDEVGDGESAVEAALRLRPSVIVVDIGLPGINGIEATSRILRELTDTKILILSMHGDETYLRQSLKAGAKGFVLKDSEEMDLVRAVTSVARGESYFSAPFYPMLLSGYLAKQQRAQA
jgi:DNA-binding NarL/FixJ family response regulator